jgi:hypothetical protein
MRILAFLTALTLGAGALATDVYKVTVTRKADDLYFDHDSRLYIVTRYCYVYAYSQEALVRWDGYTGKIIFDEYQDCDIEKIISK